MKEALSVPTQASERLFGTELAAALEGWNYAAGLVEVVKASVEKDRYGVEEAYRVRLHGDGGNSEIGVLCFIPLGVRRNVLRVPEHHGGGNAYPPADADGKIFDRFFWRLANRMYLDGLVPRPPRDM